MSRFKEAVAKQKAELDAQEPLLVPVAIGGELFQVGVKRLPGSVWAGILAKCPPVSEQHFRMGYNSERATELACREHASVTDADGAVVPMGVTFDAAGKALEDPWADFFAAVSGVELRSLAAAWWGLNEQDPNAEVEALKKASAGGA